MINYEIAQTRRLILRVPEESDIGAIVDYYRRNREFLKPFEEEKPVEYYMNAFWTERIRRDREDFLMNRSVRTFLFPKENPKRVLGVLNFNRIVHMPFSACVMGYSLDENAQGKGLMKEAAEAGIDYIFNELKLHRIMANHVPENRKSEKILQALGFEREGYARKYLFLDSRWQDHVLRSLLEEDWEKRTRG